MAALVVAGVTVEKHGSGSDPLDKLQSMRHQPADASLAREQALGVAQDFVTRFNTYGPQLLAKDGTMPKYAALSEAMTARFATVFEKNVPLAAATVQKTRVRRSAQVYAVGISTIDDDTASVLAAGIAQFAYPNPKQKGAWIQLDPEHFRYKVSLVKQHGVWLVDDLDDIDDGLPAYAEASGDPSGGQLPSSAPSLSGSSTGGGSGQ